MVDRTLLKPGDIILYSPSSLIGLWIAIKTWSWVSHVETYIGHNQCIAARFQGVNYWPLRNDKYVSYVLRPNKPFNVDKAKEWFNKNAKGDGYDLLGLFGFYGIKVPHWKHEFCSMISTMLYASGDFYPFNKNWPASKIAPAQFLQTNDLDEVWPNDNKPRLFKRLLKLGWHTG